LFAVDYKPSPFCVPKSVAATSCKFQTQINIVAEAGASYYNESH